MTEGQATRLGAADRSALAEAIGSWETTLDAATADAVAEQVRVFLEDLAAKGPAEASKGKSHRGPCGGDHLEVVDPVLFDVLAHGLTVAVQLPTFQDDKFDRLSKKCRATVRPIL